MRGTVAGKILSAHLVSGDLSAGGEIGIRIDQTLTQDATGTTAFLLLEAMGVDRVRTERSVSYVDHNMVQFGPESHNDHLYLQSVAAKVGAYFSRPGNGICHQVHLERFAASGKTLLGSDSHTPTAGGIGSIAIGAGGLDVAVAMGGGAFYLTCPKVLAVELVGQLPPGVACKDVILRLLSILTTRGNVGTIVEYVGNGVAGLPVPGRATCTNMGAELGVTTSIFPADDVTRAFLAAQDRAGDFTELVADPDAEYDVLTKRLDATADAGPIADIRRFCPDAEMSDPDADGSVNASFDRVRIDLSELEPLAAGPGSPENILTVSQLAGRRVDQVVIGSCTNSSLADLTLVAGALKGKRVHPGVEFGIVPGSRQVLGMLADSGAMADLVAAGARILECACGPCIGQGFSPGNDRLSLRTFNRNFSGRSGTPGDTVYLVSPETAVSSALTGKVTDPRQAALPAPIGGSIKRFAIDDGMVIAPPADGSDVEVVRGPTIVKPPAGEPLADELTGEVLIKVGDKITTDHIMPAGVLMKLRSNVPVYAEYVFNPLNRPGEPTFADRARAAAAAGRGGVIVAGDSYGQGSSREHAALCPMYLGVRVVIAQTIERIHQDNLVNFAILPLTFADTADAERVAMADEIAFTGIGAAIASGEELNVTNVTQGFDFACRVSLSGRQRKILAAGGLLNYTREGGQ